MDIGFIGLGNMGYPDGPPPGRGGTRGSSSTTRPGQMMSRLTIDRRGRGEVAARRRRSGRDRDGEPADARHRAGGRDRQGRRDRRQKVALPIFRPPARAWQRVAEACRRRTSPASTCRWAAGRRRREGARRDVCRPRDGFDELKRDVLSVIAQYSSGVRATSQHRRANQSGREGIRRVSSPDCVASFATQARQPARR